MGGNDTAAHTPGTRKGEEILEEHGKESGRHDKGRSHADRDAGGRSSRDSTGVNADSAKSVTETPEIPPA
jgi:hypothetical protein